MKDHGRIVYRHSPRRLMIVDLNGKRLIWLDANVPFAEDEMPVVLDRYRASDLAAFCSMYCERARVTVTQMR